jgi:hypothetical protein
VRTQAQLPLHVLLLSNQTPPSSGLATSYSNPSYFPAGAWRRPTWARASTTAAASAPPNAALLSRALIGNPRGRTSAGVEENPCGPPTAAAGKRGQRGGVAGG